MCASFISTKDVQKSCYSLILSNILCNNVNVDVEVVMR